jgi:hypothetical protein
MPLAVYILGLAIFSIGTAELMVAGMMSTLSEAFSITVGGSWPFNFLLCLWRDVGWSGINLFFLEI